MDILAGGVIVNISIISLFNQIVPQYFLELSSIAIVVDEKPSSLLLREYSDELEIFFKSAESFPPVLWISVENPFEEERLEEKILSVSELGCQGFIVASTRVVEFIELKYQVTEKAVQRQRDKYFIFLLDDQDVFPSHLIVRRSKEIDGFELITQKFVSNHDNEEGIILGYLQENKSAIVDFFPDKLKNMQGKDIPSATLTYPPYMIIDNVPPGQGNVDEFETNELKTLYMDGTEAIMMFEFSRLRNFTMKMKRFEHDCWGELYENGSSDGLLGSIYQKEVDFAVGCLSMWYYHEMEYSFTIAQSSVRFLVPGAQILPPSLTPTLPFSWKVWIAIFLTVIIDVVIYYFIEKKVLKTPGHTARTTFGLVALRISSIYLQQAAPETSRWSSVRLLLATFILSSLVVVNSYSGGLASVLTVPKYEDSIDSNQQFADSDVKWGAPSDAWIYQIVGAEEPMYKTIVKNFEIKSYDEFQKLSFSRTYGFAIERLNYGEYAFGSYITEPSMSYFDMTKEDIYFLWTCLIPVPGWPLMDYFNKHVQEVLQHGLWDYWERRITEKYFNVKVQLGMHQLSAGYRDNPGITSLKLITFLDHFFS
ncbi:uncharacterized protein LOC129789290 [Lutzomyia longipalpis]|uniref:uncharacterized protein LOC129789290 n=1 Tax=Lutzomyia longipalpis TaxID=7200 RepID=UPI0024842935|nr:uncharacterized protein LOC129789290 [Lutzomyia longipalpis]